LDAEPESALGKIVYFYLALDRQVKQRGDIVTEQEDRNVLKMLMVVVGALVGFFVVIVILAQIVAGMKTTDEGVDKMVEKSIVDRIKPFGEVNVGSAPVVTVSTAADGKGTYTSSCAACHATGAAGAPKLGDIAAWKSRIAQGDETLFDHAINGFNAMPPKGGNGSLSIPAVKAAVTYMVDNSK
jgi:cytochrome c5